MPFQSGGIFDLDHLSCFLHCPVPGQLALRLRPGLFGAVPARQRIAWLDVARDLRGHAEADAAAPHLRQANGSLAAVWFVVQPLFALADFAHRPSQVAVPFQRIHRQVEMSVENEHNFISEKHSAPKPAAKRRSI